MDFNAYTNLINSQAHLPWTLFLLTFAALTILEANFTGYKEKTPKALRWPNNLLLALLNTIVQRLIFPAFLISCAGSAFGKGFGILNMVPVPDMVGILLTILFLDWALYYFHRSLHALPWLWKFHRVHHTDPDVDVTTGVRFHTIETILTTLLKAGVIWIIGAPIYGVFCFEMVVALFTIYDHSNIHIPKKVEQALRWVFITPYMHRVHHSKLTLDRNSDYGFIFSIWDRVLGTYRAPEKVHQIDLGMESYHTVKFLRLKNLLLQPFLDAQGHFKWKNFTKDV